MNRSLITLILFMAIVTYIPRALPAVLVGRLKFSEKQKKFLSLIPYTAMAALIFPSILKVDESRPEIGLIGGFVAVILSMLRCPVIVCVGAAILINILLYSFF